MPIGLKIYGFREYHYLPKCRENTFEEILGFFKKLKYLSSYDWFEKKLKKSSIPRVVREC